MSTPMDGLFGELQGQDLAFSVAKGKGFRSPVPQSLAKGHKKLPPPPLTRTVSFTSLSTPPLEPSSATTASTWTPPTSETIASL